MTGFHYYSAMFGGSFAGSLQDPIFVVGALVAFILGAIGGRLWWAPFYAAVFTALRAWSGVAYRQTLGMEVRFDLVALFGTMWFIQMVSVFLLGWSLRHFVLAARQRSQ
ncbi:hypothetical protein [Mesorhizobium sp.]|uniref:hypothetical protein n=1 Tax=Mesorhizobium sp. TaxID=1871066 RepID=UPI003BABAA3A